MKTPRVQGLVDDVIDRYKVVTVGAWSCRHILGTFDMVTTFVHGGGV